MIIIGVDPGLQITGYGVLEKKEEHIKVREAGLIKPGLSDKLESRLQVIFDGITRLLDDYQPDKLILENLYAHYKHPATAILMGHARGVVCLAASLKNVPLIPYNPTRIKNAITGNGHASKKQVAGTVCRLLGIRKVIESPDVTDALAIALSFFHIESHDFSSKGAN